MAVAPKSPVQSANRLPLLYGAIGVVLGVLLTLGAIAGTKWWRANHTPDKVFLAKNRSSDKSIVETASGLQYKVLTAGKGPKPVDSDVAWIMYEGKLTDGTTFDKSPQPVPMKVGEPVPGFSEGLKLMPKGSKYRFWIKPSLAYGDKAVGPIPANSILVFDVDLLEFMPESVLIEKQRQMQMQGGAPDAAPQPAPAHK
ncbi:MAG: FKBP-type peptidyl-prolyl cis-trans isomerase [Pseudomonadota bacterium]